MPREKGSMATREIQYFFHPRTGSFSYVVADIDTLEAIIIDPVADYDEVQDEVSYDSVNEIIDHIKKRHLHPMAVLETHIDHDHFSGCFYLGQKLDTPVYISTCCDEKDLPDQDKQFMSELYHFEHFLVSSNHFEPDYEKVDAEISNSGSENESTLKIGDDIFYHGDGSADLPKGCDEHAFEMICELYDYKAHLDDDPIHH